MRCFLALGFSAFSHSCSHCDGHIPVKGGISFVLLCSQLNYEIGTVYSSPGCSQHSLCHAMCRGNVMPTKVCIVSPEDHKTMGANLWLQILCRFFWNTNSHSSNTGWGLGVSSSNMPLVSSNGITSHRHIPYRYHLRISWDFFSYLRRKFTVELQDKKNERKRPCNLILASGFCLQKAHSIIFIPHSSRELQNLQPFLSLSLLQIYPRNVGKILIAFHRL